MPAKRGKPLAVLLSREACTQLREQAARAGREALAARVTEALQKVAEAGMDPAIVDEAVEPGRHDRDRCDKAVREPE